MKRYLHQADPHWIVVSSGCWLWLGALDKDGYGVSWYKGKWCKAHTHLWLKSGHAPVSRGWVLDHKCRIRRCVNPDHMEPVTHATNVRRTSRTKLSEQQVREIREKRERGVRVAILAEMFAVCTGTIYYIVGRGKRSGWKPVKKL